MASVTSSYLQRIQRKRKMSKWEREKTPNLFLKLPVVVAITKVVKVIRGNFFTSRLISCNGGKVLSGNEVKAEKSVRLSKSHGGGGYS